MHDALQYANRLQADLRAWQIRTNALAEDIEANAMPYRQAIDFIVFSINTAGFVSGNVQSSMHIFGFRKAESARASSFAWGKPLFFMLAEKRTENRQFHTQRSVTSTRTWLLLRFFRYAGCTKIGYRGLHVLLFRHRTCGVAGPDWVLPGWIAV